MLPKIDLSEAPRDADLSYLHDMPDATEFLRLPTSRGQVDVVFKRKRDSQDLIVLLPAALPNPTSVFPYIPRWSWLQDLPANALCIEEAIARKYKLLAGWFHEADHFHADVIADLVNRICTLLAVSTDRVALFGSSLGGFGALMIATRVSGSLAIADIPQTDLRTYQFSRHVRDLTKSIYGDPDFHAPAQTYPDRFSVLERFRSERVIPRIHLMHEVTDEPNGATQVYPFLSALPGLAGDLGQDLQVVAEIRCNRDGHKAAGKSDVVRVLERFLIRNRV